MKTCKECGVEKPLTEFYRNPPHATGFRPRCKECLRARCREYQARPEVAVRRSRMGAIRDVGRTRVSRRSTPEDVLWRTYGLTPETLGEILARQGGACAICGATEPGGKGRWHVDHDHSCCPDRRSCGKCIRGLLCARCNPMLGMARDDVGVLKAAVQYLLSQAIQSPV